MSEIQKIIKAYKATPKNWVALATVFSTEGSSYRHPGARMLIGKNFEPTGSISGGCLEKDVIERAHKLKSNDKAKIIIYDSTSQGDLIFGSQTGCPGVIKILIEPIEQLRDHLDFLGKCVKNRQKTVSAVVGGGRNLKTVQVGDRLILSRTKSGKQLQHSRIRNSELLSNLVAQARFFLDKEKSYFKLFHWGDERVEVFFEFVPLPIQIFIFGAGDDAIPVARLAKNLDWTINILDYRATFATNERFGMADRLILSEDIENPDYKVSFDNRSAAIVMTHNFFRDVEILRFLTRQPELRYIGLLGSRKRAGKIIDELNKSKNLEMNFSRIHSPAGIDLGAETPAEIALSIIAEIQAVMKSSSGGLLKNHSVETKNSLSAKQIAEKTRFLTETRY